MEPEIVKRDGVPVCAVCGGELNAVTVAAGDPFCRTVCANEFYGFDPAYKAVTLSGHDAASPPSRHPSQWDTRRAADRRAA